MKALVPVLGLAILSIQGCKIVQIAGHGGSIVSQSGDHDCPENRICTVEVPVGEAFRDIFTAVPREGYAFAGWRESQRYLCVDKTAACILDIPAPFTELDATVHMTAEFYHQPTLESPGAIDIEYGVWNDDDVTYDDTGFFYFSADFDDDGDDDMLLASGVWKGTAEDVSAIERQEGVILLNDGDFTFTVAEGDRPSTVHPREVLLADFNGDGHNDLFIADHGYDVDPYPGASNQLLLWTEQGYDDATDRMPSDAGGFTHNAAAGDVDGDGDIDILVANSHSQTLGGVFVAGPYLLLNDGNANFTFNLSRLPDALETDNNRAPWAADIVDLDADGHEDLLIGLGRGAEETNSFIYWGSDSGEFHDDAATLLPTPEFFAGLGSDGDIVSSAVHDLNDDGRLDILLGGYDTTLKRGIQVLVNSGHRDFSDETGRRLQGTAWSLRESWHQEHHFLDFNHDGNIDIVPHQYDRSGANVLAWLNDGTGHYVALKSTEFTDAEALSRFARGSKVRVGAAFKSMEFFGDGTELSSNAAVVVTDPVITLPD